MAIKPNQVVTISYTLKDDEGNILDKTSAQAPFSFISGNDQILPKLEDEVGNMLIGGKKVVSLPAADGYGEYQKDAVQVLEKNAFPPDTDLEEGMQFVANSPDGHQMPFVITKVEEESITADFNHPLAGKNLNFDVELLDIRDATSEELSHGHVHGPGGHHH